MYPVKTFGKIREFFESCRSLDPEASTYVDMFLAEAEKKRFIPSKRSCSVPGCENFLFEFEPHSARIRYCEDCRKGPYQRAKARMASKHLIDEARNRLYIVNIERGCFGCGAKSHMPCMPSCELDHYDRQYSWEAKKHTDLKCKCDVCLATSKRNEEIRTARWAIELKHVKAKLADNPHSKYWKKKLIDYKRVAKGADPDLVEELEEFRKSKSENMAVRLRYSNFDCPKCPIKAHKQCNCIERLRLAYTSDLKKMCKCEKCQKLKRELIKAYPAKYAPKKALKVKPNKLTVTSKPSLSGDAEKRALKYVFGEDCDIFPQERDRFIAALPNLIKSTLKEPENLVFPIVVGNSDAENHLLGMGYNKESVELIMKSAGKKILKAFGPVLSSF